MPVESRLCDGVPFGMAFHDDGDELVIEVSGMHFMRWGDMPAMLLVGPHQPVPVTAPDAGLCHERFVFRDCGGGRCLGNEIRYSRGTQIAVLGRVRDTL